MVYTYKFLESIVRISDIENRFTTLEASFYPNFPEAMKRALLESLNAFLSSQSASLRILSISGLGKWDTIPRLNVLRQLKFNFIDASKETFLLFPISFPCLTDLDIWGNHYLALSSCPAWPSITSLSVSGFPAESVAVTRLCEVFPNLDKVSLKAFPENLKATLGNFMKTVSHVRHFSIKLLGFEYGYVTGPGIDFWVEFTGGAPAVSTRDLLSEDFRPVRQRILEQCSNSFASFTSKCFALCRNRQRLIMCHIIYIFQLIDLKILELSFFQIGQLRPIIYASHVGDLRLTRLRLELKFPPN